MPFELRLGRLGGGNLVAAPLAHPAGPAGVPCCTFSLVPLVKSHAVRILFFGDTLIAVPVRCSDGRSGPLLRYQ